MILIGTENVPYIVALGEASRIVTYSTSEYILRMLRLKVRLMKKFAELLGDKVS
jgi:cysteine sulfinate desulfinase/cysteine desulfurase-like protein